jgi:hypothetical protein
MEEPAGRFRSVDLSGLKRMRFLTTRRRFVASIRFKCFTKEEEGEGIL